jgi:predicted Zn-dependent protease with MMP-like domain
VVSIDAAKVIWMSGMTLREFEELVARVLDDLPPDFARKLDEGNVGVVVKDQPTEEELRQVGAGPGTTLLGLYQGVPPARRTIHYSLVLPDNISIYKEPIERFCAETGDGLPETVRKVVLHEIAHHFGIPDKRLRELGY